MPRYSRYSGQPRGLSFKSRNKTQQQLPDTLTIVDERQLPTIDEDESIEQQILENRLPTPIIVPQQQEEKKISGFKQVQDIYKERSKWGNIRNDELRELLKERAHKRDEQERILQMGAKRDSLYNLIRILKNLRASAGSSPFKSPVETIRMIESFKEVGMNGVELVVYKNIPYYYWVSYEKTKGTNEYQYYVYYIKVKDSLQNKKSSGIKVELNDYIDRLNDECNELKYIDSIENQQRLIDEIKELSVRIKELEEYKYDEKGDYYYDEETLGGRKYKRNNKSKKSKKTGKSKKSKKSRKYRR